MFRRFLLCTCLAALAPLSGAQITNQASVRYADAAGKQAVLQSNMVSAAVTRTDAGTPAVPTTPGSPAAPAAPATPSTPGTPAAPSEPAAPAAPAPAVPGTPATPAAPVASTITYYTSNDYATQAMVTAAGSRLYVQAVAPSCNADPATADRIVIAIKSSATGDTEDYNALETAADSGVFRVVSSGMPQVVAMAASAGSSTQTPNSKLNDADDGSSADVGTTSDGSIKAAKNDTLTATIMGCGTGGSVQTSILVDPAGVVFDSKSNQTLASATVTLIDVTGAGNGGQPGGPARVFDVDGTTALPSTVVTGADGAYHFPLVAPSLYRLKVVAPSNYTFPSKVKPADLPAGRTIQLYGSYGADFTISAASGAVMLDVPLDPVPGALYLEKSASRATAEIADFVDYTIRVHNTLEQDLTGVTVTDDLPAGFRFEAGSLRLDGAQAADPAGSTSSSLQIGVASVPANGVAVLRYRVRIGAGALQGDGINRAHAVSTAPVALASSVAAARVKVEASVFSEKGFIVGNVFADCDRDGLRTANEPGVPGVRVYLEDGSYAVTDAEGRYSFAELRPRTHVAKIDASTLPSGALLSILSARNAGDAGSRFVDLKDGELAKADFAIGGCSADLRSAIAARRDAVKAEERKAAAAASPAPAAKPAAAAKADLATLDNSLGFVGLEDGAVLAHAQATVRVKGTQGATFALLVNGTEVADSRIGARSSIAARQLESWEFFGVALKSGKNTLEVRQKDQFGNPRGSRSIAVVAPGALARIRLELDKKDVAADGRAMALIHVRLEDADGVAVAERTPLTLDSKLGVWLQTDLDPREAGLQAFVEGGSADFALRAPKDAGETRIEAASNHVKAETGLNFVPDLRPMVAAGVFDGAISLNRTSGNVSNPVRGFDGFEDALRHVGDQAQLGTRAAMFMKGKVANDTLLTMSYDSDKADETKLFRDLDPNAYYTTYGDDARRGFEAQSTGRLYVRADRNKSWVMYGDMTPPGVTPARNLGAYARNMNGLRTHTEFGGLSVDAFASHDSTRQMVEEIAANGTSGPYLTGSGIMVINSERIEIVVRDRNQTGRILSRKAMVRYGDYDIEPLTGRILFRAPIASLDADLNPVSIRISYEVDQGNPRFWVAGAAAQYKINKQVEIGGSYVDDRNPALPTTLASVNATVKPDARTTVIVEAARMDKAGVEGRAARIDAVRNDGNLESHVYAGRADLGFDNQSSLLPRGRVDAGATLRWKANERVTLAGEMLHTDDLTTGATRDGVQLSAGYAFNNGIRVEGGVRRAHETAAADTVLSNPDLTSVRAKVSAQVPGLPQAGVYVEGEQDVRDSGRRMAALGGEYRLAGGSRLYGRHELISSLGSNYALNEGVQRNATVFGIDSEYMRDGHVFSEYRARGTDTLASERQAEAAIGLRNLWTIAEGVRGSTSFERVQVLSGSNADEAIALAGAIEYSRDPRWKANARLELRHGADSDSILNTLALAYKLSDTWALLGKNTLSGTRSNNGGLGGHTFRGTEWLQTGVAYRALETLGWNGLAKYEYKREQDSGSADYQRAVHLVAVNANWQPTRETLFSARYAAKLANDRSSGLDSRAVAQLLSGHATHQLNDKWDVGAVAQVLVNGNGGGRQFGAGLEAGYQLRRNTWVSVGYNVLGFREKDLAGLDATAKGVYFRLRMKFDERSLDNLLAADALK